MADSDGAADVLTDEEYKALGRWRQGDFTLQRNHIPLIFETDDEGLDVGTIETCGWIVITQTCDIVNYGKRKEYVSICPIVVVPPDVLKEVHAGVTPAYGKLDLAVADDHVVDFGMTATVHKRALLLLERRDGFSDDAARSVFQQSLERRYGRFAFPDWLSNGPLRQLRKRAREAHKSSGANGNIYKAIDEFRVRGNPDLESKGSVIGFLAVVNRDKERETTRQAIRKELDTQAGKWDWPEDFIKEDEFIVVGTLDEFSGRDIKESYSVDLDFISMRPDERS
ncbi:hypothetical protein BJF92_14420 [Rhizobium rhizosphaerae]|uniref:Uncharacterized protein n=1 Tax=Xaviernesmea rhizosphaerae TaxID=1672749 RepID=A0A1Q9ACH6_9HYPH|nr:hypothetical protein [Xaviernesmea rhizosphaerae]OLP52610.1 hypothetical protein BJF92_14420 [Xaviernesmea rhizosphaerae]